MLISVDASARSNCCAVSKKPHCMHDNRACTSSSADLALLLAIIQKNGALLCTSNVSYFSATKPMTSCPASGPTSVVHGSKSCSHTLRLGKGLRACTHEHYCSLGQETKHRRSSSAMRALITSHFRLPYSHSTSLSP